MFRKPDITINISSLTVNNEGVDMASLIQLEEQEIATINAIATDVAAIKTAVATPVPTTVDLTAVTDAIAALTAKVDALDAKIGTPTT